MTDEARDKAHEADTVGGPFASEAAAEPSSAATAPEAPDSAEEAPVVVDARSATDGGGEGPPAVLAAPAPAQSAVSAEVTPSPESCQRGESDGAQPETSGEAKPPADEAKWYVVTTYSGFEHKAKQALQERIAKSPLRDLFKEVLLPAEESPEGDKKARVRSFFPGYIFVRMVMNEQTWALVKGTPRVTNFVGGQKPTPVLPEQIREIQKQISEGAIKAKPKVAFSEGDRVRVSQGPFVNMSGTVSSINPVKQMVRVLVSIFGRATPVELEFHQVEKLP